MDMIKVAVIGMIGSLLAMSLKSAKGDFSAYVNLGTCVVVLLFVAGRLSGIIGQIEQIADYVSIEGDYIAILLKMAGLTYIAEFAGALCRDMGYSALAVQIENFGKLSLLFISCPVIVRLLQTIGELL